jgi:hypothetical protein
MLGTMHQLKEDSPMFRRLVVAMLGLGVALFLMPQVSLAAEAVRTAWQVWGGGTSFDPGLRYLSSDAYAVTEL